VSAPVPTDPLSSALRLAHTTLDGAFESCANVVFNLHDLAFKPAEPYAGPMNGKARLGLQPGRGPKPPAGLVVRQSTACLTNAWCSAPRPPLVGASHLRGDTSGKPPPPAAHAMNASVNLCVSWGAVRRSPS
jgi:hypothetical protein